MAVVKTSFIPLCDVIKKNLLVSKIWFAFPRFCCCIYLIQCKVKHSVYCREISNRIYTVLFFVILAPDKPSNLRVKAQFAYYFVLEWEAPTKVHGIITGYQVSGTHYYGISGKWNK